MAQIVRNTSGMTGINVSALQSLITTLKNNMKVGKDITASDMNQLINAYNTWIQHTHTATDLRGKDTYGNRSYYGSGTYAPTPTSSQALDATSGTSFSSSALIKAVNDYVLASDANEAVTKINAIRSHKHSIYDTTA